MEETLTEIATKEEGDAPPPPAEDCLINGRVEIDTSAPFESVKEAVDRFGGSAVWKSQLKQLLSPKKPGQSSVETEIAKLEEQTAQLENDLIIKERETLDVLKELEMTKKVVADLKLKIQKETSITDSPKIHPINESPENENKENIPQNSNFSNVLTELKQAKLKFCSTTADLASIRASINLVNQSIERERILLEKTREKLNANTATVTLEQDLSQTTVKLQLLRDQKANEMEGDPLDVTGEIKEMSSEIDRLREMMESARSEVAKLTAEIDQTKASIKTAEIRCTAARKMEQAARAAETLALTEINAIVNSNNSNSTDSDAVALSVEECSVLTLRAREAEEGSRKRVESAMCQVDEANRSKLESLKKLEEAKLEARVCKKALETALKREEAAIEGKLLVEDALRKWRSDGSCQQRKHGVQSVTMFKNYGGTHHRKDCSRMFDMGEGKPTLSIGQILSMKLTDEYDNGVWERGLNNDVINNNNVNSKNVSLGQMLNRKSVVMSLDENNNKAVKKRKKFGFVGISVLLAKQQKNKKKRQSWG